MGNPKFVSFNHLISDMELCFLSSNILNGIMMIMMIERNKSLIRRAKHLSIQFNQSINSNFIDFRTKRLNYIDKKRN